MAIDQALVSILDHTIFPWVILPSLFAHDFSSI